MTQTAGSNIPSIYSYADPQAVFEKAMRTIVEAVIPLEALIMSDGVRHLSPAIQEGVLHGAHTVRAFVQEVMPHVE